MKLVVVVLLMVMVSRTLSIDDTKLTEEQKQAILDKVKEQYNQVYRGVYLFRKYKEGQGVRENFQLNELFINKYGVYHTKPGSDDVIDMIRFDEIIGKKSYDSIKKQYTTKKTELEKTGKEEILCCDNLIAPRFYDYDFDSEAASLNCMVIIDPEYQRRWEICDQKFPSIDDFLGDETQSSTTIVTVKRFYKITVEQSQRYIQIREGLIDESGLSIVLTDTNQDNKVQAWTYSNQGSWSAKCQMKTQQSPINLKDADVLYTTKNMQVKFEYEGDVGVRLVEGINNNFLLGNFGKMIFFDAESGRENTEYRAFRIEMHYQSEHQINENTFDAEVVVYHTNQDNFKLSDMVDKYQDRGLTIDQESQMMSELTDLIVSFLIKVDPMRSDDDDGYFWSAFSQTVLPERIVSSRFNVNSVITKLADDKQPRVSGSKYLYSLEAMIKGGLVSQFKKSFYHYMGSFSVPGCDNVERIVMAEKILVSKTALDDSRKIMNQLVDQSNSRAIQNAGTEGAESKTQKETYQIRYHVDTSEICQQQNLSLEKFRNFDLGGGSSYSSQISKYESMIKTIKDQQESYQSIINKYNLIRGRKTNGNGDGDDTDNKDSEKDIDGKSSYSYEKVKKHQFQTEISTNIQHMHQVPSSLSEKIFNKKASELIVGGDSTRLGLAPIDIVYMGQNAKQYSTFQSKLQTSQQNKQVLKGTSLNSIIQDHDRLYGEQVPEDLQSNVDNYQKNIKGIMNDQSINALQKSKGLYGVQKNNNLAPIIDNLVSTRDLLIKNAQNLKSQGKAVDPINQAIENLKEDQANKERLENQAEKKKKRRRR